MIDVLFFAELQEAAGKANMTIDAAGITVSDLKTNYLNELAIENIDQAMVAINEEYAEEDSIIKSGDVIAFIPPVSGG
ncbi:molybdopterin converting factor subunit 1 [Virgibacillus phasianinus]|uniref:Molybdopterin synthase sulfur carrier subunit n=1 Tax=Virgibacillus phasianinus TaxID=2017483 RepID=A0A220TXV0_9BACI|nr:molybdopterin converting factor subunit 1 [Virgibacillus phasianinus]ASK60814.1 molybdopterin converting factor subunit 1 [Virgibacillus phasianinus]